MISRANTFNVVNQNGAISRSNYNHFVDVGYDTDTIAIFEIDKSFTDYLLCQICFSKCGYFLNHLCNRNEQRPERVRLLQQALLQALH